MKLKGLGAGAGDGANSLMKYQMHVCLYIPSFFPKILSLNKEMLIAATLSSIT